MARIRTIKPDFWTDEKVVSLTPLARLFFIGIWNFVDDDGRAEYSPLRLKMQILPADPVEVSEILGELQRERLIDVYEVDGKEYLQVTNFSKHQKVDNRSKSKHPPPPPNPTEFPRPLGDNRTGREGKGRDQGKEEETADAVSSSGKYAFEQGVIRLTSKDLLKWKKAFSHLEVEAELIALAGWAGLQGQRWFFAVSGALAKRNREVGQQKVAPEYKYASGIPGVL